MVNTLLYYLFNLNILILEPEKLSLYQPGMSRTIKGVSWIQGNVMKISSNDHLSIQATKWHSKIYLNNL